MINVKDQIFSALSEVFDNLSDLYPIGQYGFPCAQITEEANTVYTKTDNEEKLAYLRYRVDIWNSGSTSALALATDEALAALGLTRTECADVPDPSNQRHKQMRYEGIIDVNSEEMYWNGNQ